MRLRAAVDCYVFIACASLVVSAAVPSTLRLGFFDWVSYYYSDPGVPYDLVGSQIVSVNFFLAAEMFNQRRSDVLAVLGTPELLACPVNISIPRMCDTAGSSHQILRDFRNLSSDYDALVGFASSAELFVSGQAADAIMRWPVINHWCSSPLLRDRTFFPTLARTGQDDGEYAIPVCRLLYQLGFSQVALMYMVGDSGPAFHDSVVAECGGFGVDISAFDYEDSTPSSIEAALAKVAASQLNFVVFHGYNSDYASGSLPDLAVAAGLTGGDHLWMFTNFDLPVSQDQMATLPNVTALHGGSFRPAMTIPPDQLANFDHWKVLWTTEFSTYVDSINKRLPPFGDVVGDCIQEALDYKLAPDFFETTVDQAFEVWAFAADTVFTFGVAACNYSTGSGSWDADALFAQVMNADFEGLSGHVRFNASTGDRLASDKITVLQNWKLVNGSNNSDWVLAQVGVYTLPNGVDDFRQGTFVLSDDFVTPLGPMEVPPDITPPPLTTDYIPMWMKALGYTEAALQWLSCLAAMALIVVYRNHAVIVNSQLYLSFGTVLGCIVVTLTSLALTANDDPATTSVWGVDHACMIAPLAFVLGFQVSLLTLIGKSYRIWRIFSNKSAMPLRIRTYHVLGFISAILAAEAAISVAWLVEAPLRWEHNVLQTNQFGFALSEHAGCEAPNGAAGFIVVLFTLHGIALMASMVAARAVRELPQEFQESKWISYANLGLAQIYFLAVPAVAAVYQNPDGLFIIASTAVFLSTETLLFFLFVPKLVLIRTGKEMWTPSTRTEPGRVADQGKKSSQNRSLVNVVGQSPLDRSGSSKGGFASGSKFLDTVKLEGPQAARSARSNG